jgi:hypothetical protein
MLGAVLERLRAGGIAIEVVETQPSRGCDEDRARGLRSRAAEVYCGGRGWDFV